MPVIEQVEMEFGILTPPKGVETLIKSADLDGCYRYSLWRCWKEGAPILGVIMLNPSTADAETDDPTIRRLYGFARREGFGAISVANLFALRSADPKLLPLHPHPVGPQNNHVLGLMFTRIDTILCAWGSGWTAKRPKALRALYEGSLFWRSSIHRHPPRLVCLGTTANGSPRHPLYVRADQPFEDYRL